MDAYEYLKHTEGASSIRIDVQCTNQAPLAELQAFEYTAACSVAAEADAVLLQDGCSCREACTAQCHCQVECHKGLAALQQHGRSAGVVCLLECGPACACDHDCPARKTQQGLAVPVALSWHQGKGWGVHAASPIAQGAFVCEYAGECVSAAEAARRLQTYDASHTQGRGHALLTVRLQLPSQTTSLRCSIDATKMGNIARFLNHSCDGGNLEAVLVSCRGSLLLRVALFAARDIAPGEELTYSYAGVEAASAGPGAAGPARAASSRRRCFCGTAACSGFLPSAS